VRRPRAIAILLLTAATAFADTRGSAAPAARWIAVDRVAAVVNGEVILLSDVERRLATFKRALEDIADPADRARGRIELRHRVLDGLIDESLFGQEATRLGVGVTDDEVARAIEQVKQQNGMDDAAMAKALGENGYTMQTYRKELQRQIRQVKVMGVLIRPHIHITDQELRAAYDEAKKADPKLGSFDAEQERIRASLFEQRVPALARQWLDGARAAASIEVRR
jgi:parvulin-like peptidyl-prolyl isomerase